MKKSEAVLLIAECLVEPHHHDVMKESEYILNKLLRAGMLPPMQPIPEYAFQAPNEWESEDE